ncbi:MAG: methyltransferase domain-containing protein [Planctomycetota bacterium]
MSPDFIPDRDDRSTEGRVSPAMIRAARVIQEGTSPQQAVRTLQQAERLVLQEIVQSQERARRKFGDWSDEAQAFWWVTPTGCAQATTAEVAKLKASWFGNNSVVDVCCGVGGDLMALAARGHARGIDADPRVLAYARLNLRTANLDAETHCRDVMTDAVDRWSHDAQCLHVDPDRRDQGQRRTASESLVPPWSVIRQWLPAFEGGVIKLAPATNLDIDTNMNLHRSWISLGNQVREQDVVFGTCLENPSWHGTDLAANSRSAMMKRTRGSEWSLFSVRITSESIIALKEQPQAWLIDPDRAIRAAGLTIAFANEYDLQCVGGPAGYLTTDNAKAARKVQPYATVVAVIATLATDNRKLRRHFRSNRLIPQRIKVRGGSHSPDQLHKQLKPKLDGSSNTPEWDGTPVELWIGRTGRGAGSFAAVCQPRDHAQNAGDAG